MGDMTDAEPAQPAPRRPRPLEPEALKALAHPLRVRILDTLSLSGASTASGLAARLGESSGATSYHLRQLARYHLVEEMPERGSARERWWRRVPEGFTVSVDDQPDSASRAAARIVLGEWHANREALLDDFIARGDVELPREWRDAAMISTFNLRLTAEQLAQVVDALGEFAARVLDPLRGQDLPGARPVQLQFNAFPVLDGEETRR
jgi:DNA-binding transcriptional ArsR family regulator